AITHTSWKPAWLGRAAGSWGHLLLQRVPLVLNHKALRLERTLPNLHLRCAPLERLTIALDMHCPKLDLNRRRVVREHPHHFRLQLHREHGGLVCHASIFHVSDVEAQLV